MIKRGPNTASDLRRFGFVVAGAFGTLGAVSLWRGRPAAPYLAGIAAALFAAAVIAPAWLRPIERVWMVVGERLAMISTRVILTVTFFLVITPLAVIRRLTGDDPLALRFDPAKESYWTPVERDGPGARPDKPY